MNITSVLVEGVGKFGTRSEIAGLGPGVNILAAGNEAGKSTLFRAIRACLFERHNTRNEIVRNLATDGLSLPVTITLGFDHEGQSYSVTKSFIKSPAASLMRSGVEIARGREADEMIWELLGIAPGSGRSVDEAAFGILWVGQGQSFHVPEPSEAATTALNTAIQAEVGTLVGGERARSALSALRDQLAVLITDTGRPKTGGPFASAAARLEAADVDLADAERKLSILDTQLVGLAAKRSERNRLGDPALLAKMTTDLAAAQQDLKLGEAAAALLSQFETAEQRSKAGLDRAERRVADLEERRTRIERDRKRETQLRSALNPIDEQEVAARAVIQRARDEIAALGTQAQGDDEQERILQRLSICIARAAGRPSLIHQQQVLEELEQRIVKNAAGLSGNRATAEVMSSLDRAERELSVLTARLEASAPEVAIELGEPGVGQVLIGDAPLAASVVQAAIDPLIIRVGDLATITVSPPVARNATDSIKRVQLQAHLANLIADAGMINAAELRAAHARRQQLETEAVGLQAEIGGHGVRGTTPVLAIERIKTEIEEINGLVAEVLSQSNLEILPIEKDVECHQSGLRQKREEARRKRQGLDGTIEAQNAILSGLADARGRLSGTLAEIQNSLDGDLATLPDADRSQLMSDAELSVTEARDEYRSKAAAVEGQRQLALSREDLERHRIRAERLQRALESHKTRLGLLEKEIANLEGRIQNAGGDGLGEKVGILRAERDLADREVNRHKSRIAVLVLLKETIEACYKEQRARLHAPLRRHLQPFLNDVFPTAELELGDDFSIAGIRRDGPAAEDFERLSTGTQEQIAVLVRLAMGAMICERGQPVPIILDDALVFSDDDRIEQMFDALSRAGQKQQVIVLTCRTRTFAVLGGRQLSIVSQTGGSFAA